MRTPDLLTVAARNLAAIKETAPLVHAITNYVTAGWVADVLSAAGASPIMADAVEEVETVTALTEALVLNLGTLNRERLSGMLAAGKTATALGRPIVLDPVGAGALPARTQAALDILADIKIKVSVIRANASEILALAGKKVQARGVDSGHPVASAQAAAQQVALTFGLTVVVTGTEDLVTDGHQPFLVRGGHPLMGRISGTGCALGALIGAFLTVDADPRKASLSALTSFNLAGEMAAEKGASAGSFKPAMVDALDMMTPESFKRGLRIADDQHP